MTPPPIETITCLSVQQPYASAIFFDGKWCENRSWSTTYRGELWIHASRLDQQMIDDAAALEVDLNEIWPDRLHTGCLLGRVNLIGCFPASTLLAAASPEALKAMGLNKRNQPPVTAEISHDVEFIKSHLAGVDPLTWSHFTQSQFAWLLADAEYILNPYLIPGKLKLWSADISSHLLTLMDWEGVDPQGSAID